MVLCFGVVRVVSLVLVCVSSLADGQSDNDDVYIRKASFRESPTALHDSAGPTALDCDLCAVVVKKLGLVGGNTTSINNTIQHLQEDCDKVFSHNSTLYKACSAIANQTVEILPFLDDQIGTLAWDNKDVCAVLNQCEVPCCKAKSTPEQIHLSLRQLSSEMRVTWVTLRDTNTHTVQWGLSEQAVSSQQQDGTVTTYTQAGWIGKIHSAVMVGLKPSTDYFYRVGDATGGFSPVFKFRTLCANPATDACPLTVGVVGDMGYANHSDVTIESLTRLASSGQIDLLVHNGDISYADGSMKHWDTFSNKVQPIATRVPYLSSPGNHEIWFNFTAYRKRYGNHMPNPVGHEEGMFWDLELGGLHLVAMNTESVLDVAEMKPAQLRWMRSVLTETKSKEEAKEKEKASPAWKVAFGHRPWYCSNGKAKEMKTLQVQAEEILFEGGVDLVIQAHVHDYERTLPMHHGLPTSTNYSSPTAPVYVVNGAAGNREAMGHPKGNQPWDPPVSNNTNTTSFSDEISFGVMKLTDKVLQWQQFYANGTLLDSFAITK